MKLVIIESPFKGDVERNKRYLRSCIRDCINRGESPYASHRMLTDALDDNDPIERTLGIEAGLAWRNVTQPVFRNGARIHGISTMVHHVFYVDLGISDGMAFAETRYSNEGIPYEERTLPPNDPFFTAPIRPPELTEEELTMLSVCAPNLACIIEREPPRAEGETRKRAREELASLLRGIR